MNVRFLIFLLIVFAIVVALVIFEQNRDNPWDSDVFFSRLNGTDTYLAVNSITSDTPIQDTTLNV